MHHGSSVVKMDDLMFMLFSSRSIFPFALFRKNLCFRNELTTKNTPNGLDSRIPHH